MPRRLFNIVKNLFGQKSPPSDLSERFLALQREYEKLQTENVSLRGRLAKYEPHVSVSDKDIADDADIDADGGIEIDIDIDTDTGADADTDTDTDTDAGVEISDDRNDDKELEAPRFAEQISLDALGSNSRADRRDEVVQTIEAAPLPQVDRTSSNDEKIQMFLSLFVGRCEYFAKHYRSKKTNSSAYSPVCDNEWDDFLCNKRTKEYTGSGKNLCAQCRHPAYTPFNADAVRNHLRGYDHDRKGHKQDFIAGIYPLLDDHTCRFLAVDFDAHNAEPGNLLTSLTEDVKMFDKACAANDVPVYFERSRSGNGFHAWIFFSKPVKASDARKMGSGLISYAMEHFGHVSFKSYDRFFPNQDLLPKGGFGNLIALPLQQEARESGNTVFLNDDFEPYEDQWAFLSNIKRMTQTEVLEIKGHLCGATDDGLGELAESGDPEETSFMWEKRKLPMPLKASDFHDELEIVLSNMIFIPKAPLSKRAANRIRRLAVIKNPKFAEQQRMRLPVKDLPPRLVSSVREDETHIGIPRGLLPALTELFEQSGVRYHINDLRNEGTPIKVTFNGKLRDEQPAAAEEMQKHEIGVLHAATAFGKTVVGDYLIAEKKVNTLIIVPNTSLMSIWVKSLEDFLMIDHVLPDPEVKRGRPKKRSVVGQLGGGKNMLNGIVDIAIYKSLLDGDSAKDLVKDYGMVIVDECHHVGAYSYEQVLNHVNAKYVYGVTATPIRSDGLDALIFFHCGPIRFKTDMKAQMDRHGFDHVMIPRFTTTRPIMLSSLNNMPSIHSDLVKAENRNRKILNDIIGTLEEGRTPLVLTERVEHIEVLAKALEAETEDIEIIRLFGGLSAKEKRVNKELLSGLPAGKQFVIVATNRYIGEGFDYPALDTLFLVAPIKWEGRLEQYVGRLHRVFEGKEEVRVYDYIDIHVPVLERMYRVRLKGYARFGYTVRTETNTAENIGMIYYATDYLDNLKLDLKETGKCVSIAGPNISKTREAEIKKQLPASDISVEVLHSDLRFLIIDRRIVWYGEVNYFGKNNGDETCLRLDNRELAEELLEFSHETKQITLPGLSQP